ncbi:hypothetical protein ACFQ0N_01665 [Paenibacillus sp. GCM10027626]
MKVNIENIAKLQKYFDDLHKSSIVSSIAPVRETEIITIVRTLDMLGLDVPGINYPDEVEANDE